MALSLGLEKGGERLAVGAAARPARCGARPCLVSGAWLHGASRGLKHSLSLPASQQLSFQHVHSHRRRLWKGSLPPLGTLGVDCVWSE